MCIDSAGSLYHGAVVCQTSLRAAIPGILLFCGIVQLGSAPGPASGGSSWPCQGLQPLSPAQEPAALKYPEPQHSSEGNIWLFRLHLKQGIIWAKSYLKWTACAQWRHHLAASPHSTISLSPHQRTVKFILLTSLIDRLSSHLVLISRCWTHQFLRWERWGESPSRALQSWNALRRSGRGWFFVVLFLCKAQRPLGSSLLSLGLLFRFTTSKV